MSNPFDEESDAAKDDLDLGGEDEFAAKSGGDVESRSGGDVESLQFAAHLVTLVAPLGRNDSCENETE